MKNTITTIAMLAALGASAQMPPEGKVKPQPMQPIRIMQQAVPASKADYEKLRDSKNEQVVYKGVFAYRDMEQEPTFSWLPAGMDKYDPDPAATNYLSQAMGSNKLLIFIGTWCEDSQHLLPKLLKVLSKANIAWEDVMMIGMDREKTTNTEAAQLLVKQYKITLLPTIVVLDANGAEAGRIIESAKKSIEWDLVKILSSTDKE